MSLDELRVLRCKVDALEAERAGMLEIIRGLRSELDECKRALGASEDSMHAFVGLAEDLAANRSRGFEGKLLKRFAKDVTGYSLHLIEKLLGRKKTASREW